MKKQLIRLLVFIFIIAIGCKDKLPMNLLLDKENETASFKLQNNLYDFSSKMSALDTVIIISNLSLCLTQEWDTTIIFKSKDRVFIQSIVYGDYISNKRQKLNQREYKIDNTDSLNFENLFKYLNDKKLSKGKTYEESIGGEFVHVINKSDTVRYFIQSLSDQEDNINYYHKIRKRIYPDEDL